LWKEAWCLKGKKFYAPWKSCEDATKVDKYTKNSAKDNKSDGGKKSIFGFFGSGSKQSKSPSGDKK